MLSPLCVQCGMMFKSREGPDHLCQDCLTRPRRFSRARAAGVYHKSLMSLVLALKYRGKTRVAAPLGRWLFETFADHWAAGEIDRIIPVPPSCQAVSEPGVQPGLPADPPLAGNGPGGCRRCAARGRWSGTPWCETGPLSARPDSTVGPGRKTFGGAFSVSRPEAVAGRRILLVDDVMTTGATVEACARILRSAGAERVDVLTLARAVRW